MYYLGVDLGGTNTAAGLTDEKGNILGKFTAPTPKGAEAISNVVAHTAREAAKAAGVVLGEVRSVGIASAGTISDDRKMVLHAYNLELDHAPLAQMVEERLGIPVELENDANAAALGEFIAGAGKGGESLVAVTLGTGVGAGAVLGGKLFTGFNYAGMEAGHMVIRQGGWQCTCGRRGCWEAYASATGMIRATREAMEAHPESGLWRFAGELSAVNGKVAFDAAQSGDEVAQGVVDDYIAALSCGLTNLVNLLQPEVLCIGGGIAGQGEALLKPVRDYLDREEFTKDSPRRTEIRTAQLGNDAGIVGAALLPLYR